MAAGAVGNGRWRWVSLGAGLTAMGLAVSAGLMTLVRVGRMRGLDEAALERVATELTAVDARLQSLTVSLREAREQYAAIAERTERNRIDIERLERRVDAMMERRR